MLNKKDIDNYIKRLPPTPKILTKVIHLVNHGELTKAAKLAEEDKALKAYMQDLIDRPIYGFKNKITNLAQVFTILGLNGTKQSLYNYSLSLLTPKKWSVFKLNQTLFYNLQALLSVHWHQILQYLNIDDKDIECAITLLPSSIIICDRLLKDNMQDINLITTSKALDYNTIIKRLTSLDIFDISCQIVKLWEMPKQIICIIQASSGIKPSSDENINILAKWMHLLLFYELSQAQFIEAELNNFIAFNIDYVSDIYDDFIKLMEIQ